MSSCVFVVLPVVGGLVYSFSVSAEAAARYYAEAVAQGRFEDAMAVESADADAGSGVGRGDAVDLRRGRVSEASPAMSVTGVWVHTNPDGNGRQGITIDFTADGRSTSRVIYLERSGLPRPYITLARGGSFPVRRVRSLCPRKGTPQTCRSVECHSGTSERPRGITE